MQGAKAKLELIGEGQSQGVTTLLSGFHTRQDVETNFRRLTSISVITLSFGPDTYLCHNHSVKSLAITFSHPISSSVQVDMEEIPTRLSEVSR